MRDTLSGRIKSELRRRDLTVTELAEYLGASRTAFSSRLNADRIDEPELERIGAYLELSLAYLRYGVRGSYVDGWRDCAASMFRALALQADPPVAATPSAIAGEIAPRAAAPADPAAELAREIARGGRAVADAVTGYAAELAPAPVRAAGER